MKLCTIILDMPTRHADWFKQAKRDLQHARHALEDCDFDWACFAAHQAAEKAVKAIYQSMGVEARGRSVHTFLDQLPAAHHPGEELKEVAKGQDKPYIPSFPRAIQTPTPRERLLNITPKRKRGEQSAMQNKLSDSVRIIWLDCETVLGQVRRAVKEMAVAHPEIERVVLFGSLARGDAVPGSDADLLIVLGEIWPAFFWSGSCGMCHRRLVLEWMSFPMPGKRSSGC